jgi:hypothetical protein
MKVIRVIRVICEICGLKTVVRYDETFEKLAIFLILRF